MLNLATVKNPPYGAGVDSFEVRREYLRQGGRIRETARVLNQRGTKTSPQNVAQHVNRANRLRPLTYQQGDLEDRAAVQAFVLKQLERVGVRAPAVTLTQASAVSDPISEPIEDIP